MNSDIDADVKQNSMDFESEPLTMWRIFFSTVTNFGALVKKITTEMIEKKFKNDKKYNVIWSSIFSLQPLDIKIINAINKIPDKIGNNRKIYLKLLNLL